MLPEVGSEAKLEKRRLSLKTISLFEQKRARGFWPCYRRDEMGQRELTVLTHEHHKMMMILMTSGLPGPRRVTPRACGARKKAPGRAVYDKFVNV